MIEHWWNSTCYVTKNNKNKNKIKSNNFKNNIYIRGLVWPPFCKNPTIYLVNSEMVLLPTSLWLRLWKVSDTDLRSWNHETSFPNSKLHVYWKFEIIFMVPFFFPYFIAIWSIYYLRVDLSESIGIVSPRVFFNFFTYG